MFGFEKNNVQGLVPVFTNNIAIIYRISDPESSLDRMVNVVRWWFSKDLKYITGKLIKPYNSILGETFNCHWEVPRDHEQTQIYSQNKSQKPISIKCMNEQVSQSYQTKVVYQRKFNNNVEYDRSLITRQCPASTIVVRKRAW